jgi:ATP-dependent Lon protease
VHSQRYAQWCLNFKDGPSAGVGIFSSLLSLFRGKSLRPSLAMTGEISLRGEVLPIGGLSEKVHAASRGGIKTLIAPHENRYDLKEIPKEVKEGMEFIFVKTLEELEAALFVVHDVETGGEWGPLSKL